MLTHIVCWKYKTETTEEDRKEHLRRLRALPTLIREIESFQAGFDILHLERSFHVGLVAVFHGTDELDAYTVHPEHAAVAEIGKKLAERVVSVDFMIP